MEMGQEELKDDGFHRISIGFAGGRGAAHYFRNRGGNRRKMKEKQQLSVLKLEARWGWTGKKT
ncbi:hypothetical protein NR756_08470 [Alloalcanivorax xenomutans]|uniref:hypothetical protein n=1 Tax=Alloalcanivorax xenomutans TaxID=1094342 RepID=UPI0013D3AA09